MNADDWGDDAGEWAAVEVPWWFGWLVVGGVILGAWFVF